MFIADLFAVAMIENQHKSLLKDKWTQTMLYVYTVGCYLAVKENDILPFVEPWEEREDVCK